MTKIQELAALGQAVWLDYIRRSFTTGGDLQRLIDMGLRGMTSNPSIFEKAIAHSADYDQDFERLAQAGKSAEEIYTTLVLEDIRQAADLFRPVYEATQGQDGYVSLEVDPTLAHDTQSTIREAQRLWSLVDRPNLMIKIPATKAGLEAITQSLAAGINVNVTLIFSLERYAEVMAAYIAGLELRHGLGKPIDRIASVASFFVSRLDTKVDRRLEAIIQRRGEAAKLASSLLGKAAVANACMAYQQFKSVIEQPFFQTLRARGARVQRPLWASTSTKNPAYSDIKYVQELIGADTVNTLPQSTLEHFLDHGEVTPTLEENLDETRYVLESLEDLGISMAQVTQELEDEGVEAFRKSFEDLMGSIETRLRREQPAAGKTAQRTKEADVTAYDGGSPAFPIENNLAEVTPSLKEKVDQALAEMAGQQALRRIWEQDYTLWQPDPQEISNRLGWLDIAARMQENIPEIQSLVDSVKEDGYTQVLLLGMGGSSLAPDLFGRTFSGQPGGLALHVVDSTDPDLILSFTETLDPSKTLFIVATKSGTTEETLSFFRYFFNWTAGALDEVEAGKHFVAITDPGSKLVDLAAGYHFRTIFKNDPNIGGRYSALSYFGLVPAALAGVDLSRLLNNATQMAGLCQPGVPPQENPAAQLGVILGEAAKTGGDKVTFIISDQVASFGDWVEQLIAESTGKQGKGILPVVREPLGAPADYGRDRLFVHIPLAGDRSQQAALDALRDSGFPVIRIPIQDRYDLGGQFFLWELAIAVAGYRLGINPFNQPNVESAKKRARQMVAAYKEAGSLPEKPPLLSQEGIAVYGPKRVADEGTEWILEADTPYEALAKFLAQSQNGDYIALQAFIPPTEENEKALQALRVRLRDQYQLATTLGFGPRFLHSTGQLHKGGAANGLFLQFTCAHPRDVPIPDEAGLPPPGRKPESSITFGVLELAQALGDRQALEDAGRRVLRFHLLKKPADAIRSLAETRKRPIP